MIDLMSFCGNDREIRSYLQTPFELDGWVYATNGHLAVRVLRSAWAGAAAYIHGKHPKNIANLFEDAFAAAGDFLPFPMVSEPMKCDRCNGSGVDPEDTDDGPQDCLECGGTGYVREVLPVGGAHYATHYLWRMRVLPEAQIKPREMNAPAAIHFVSGQALLMPCRP